MSAASTRSISSGSGGVRFASSSRPMLGSWIVRIALTVCALGAAGIVLWIMVALFGSVTGEEFSPDHFTRRQFYYFEIPLVKVQVWPIKRQRKTNKLERHLIKGKFIRRKPAVGETTGDEPKQGPSKNDRTVNDRTDKPADKKSKKTVPPEPPYDLVFVQRGQMEPSEGDCAVLCRYLDAKDANEKLVWLFWTEEHPKLAKVLWPAVAEVSRKQLYILAPDLFDLARSATDAQWLQQAIGRQLLQKYRQFADAQQELGNHQTAVELYTAALSHASKNASPKNTSPKNVPGKNAILIRRAKSYEAMNKPDQAAADRRDASS